MKENEKIVLVNHLIKGVGDIRPPLGLAYLASYLRTYVGFHNLAIVNADDGVFELIRREEPSLVGFLSYTVNYQQVLESMRRVKEELRVPVIVGGPHVSSLPHRLSQWADVGVIGEGEQTFSELVKLWLGGGKLDPGELRRIKGIVFHSHGQPVITERRELIDPVDAIPFPDRSLFDIDRYLRPSPIVANNEYLRGTTLLTARGCPYKCAYCQSCAFWGRVRLHSPEYVAEEIQMLVRDYGVVGISIVDDLFTIKKERIRGIIDRLGSAGLLGKVKYFVDCRADLADDEMMRLLKELNVVSISIGVESGSDRVLRYLKKGTVTVEQNRRAIRLANSYGIRVYACTMLGTPFETKEDMLKTQDFIREMLNASPLNAFQVTVTTPLPGTELWDYAIERGFVQEEMDWSQFGFSPYQIAGRDFYINQEVDFDEFLSIVRDTAELCTSRRLPQILSNLSMSYVKRGLTDPRMAFRLVRSWWRGKHLQ